MEAFRIALYEKDLETGILENMVGSYLLENNVELIDRIYAIKEENLVVHMIVTTDRDVEDWEFSAIYDYFDEAPLVEAGITVEEVEDPFNPAWDLKFDYASSEDEMETRLNEIIGIYGKELKRTYEEIKDKKEEYNE